MSWAGTGIIWWYRSIYQNVEPLIQSIADIRSDADSVTKIDSMQKWVLGVTGV